MLIHPCLWNAWFCNYESTRPPHLPSSARHFDLWSVRGQSRNHWQGLRAFGFPGLGKVGWTHKGWPSPGHSILWPSPSLDQQARSVRAALTLPSQPGPWGNKAKKISLPLNQLPPSFCGWAIRQQRIYSFPTPLPGHAVLFPRDICT